MYEFFDYRVEDVMSRPVTVLPTCSLGEVEVLLEKHGFNALPVVDENQCLVGFVTSLDLLKAFDFPDDVILPRFEEVMAAPVETVMRRDVFTVCPRTPLTRIVSKIVQSRNKSFPVVDEGHAVGIIAREDVMLALRRGTSGQRP